MLKWSCVPAESRRSLAAEAITWILIIGASVAATLAVIALYNGLIEKQAEPVEQIINPSP